MLLHLIDWLSQNRKWNYFIVAGYFIFILAMHDPMVNLSVWLMNKLLLQNYNIVVGVVFVLLVAGMLYYLIGKLKEFPEARNLKITYLIITLIFIFIHMQTLFVMNIEIIHAFQFGILAILIFPLSQRFGHAVYFTTLLGLADELFQYLWLYPDDRQFSYLDFNDMVINLLGAGFAMAALFIAGANNKETPPPLKWYRSPVVISAALLASVTTLLFSTSYMSFYTSTASPHTVIILNQIQDLDAFWRHIEGTDIVYHILRPLPGTILLAILCGFYFLLDALIRRISGNEKLQIRQV